MLKKFKPLSPLIFMIKILTVELTFFLHFGAGSGRQRANSKTLTGGQGIAGGSAGEGSAMGGQTGRRGAGDWEGDRPAGT